MQTFFCFFNNFSSSTFLEGGISPQSIIFNFLLVFQTFPLNFHMKSEVMKILILVSLNQQKKKHVTNTNTIE